MKHTDEEKNCALCEYSHEIADEDNVLCEKRGVVSRGHVCHRYSLDLFKLSPTPNAAPLFDPLENFQDLLQ